MSQNKQIAEMVGNHDKVYFLFIFFYFQNTSECLLLSSCKDILHQKLKNDSWSVHTCGESMQAATW